MAAPNLKSPTTINGKTVGLAATTSATAVVANAAASGKCLRVGTVIVTNITAATAGTITLDVYNGTTAYRVHYLVGILQGNSFVAIGRDEPLYLEEGWSLRATASANSVLEVVASYEDIS